MAFHLWTISEVYSNTDGSVQFIELFTTASSETEIAGHAISFTPTGGSTATYVVPSGLTSSTTDKSLLFATEGFAALGLVTPDYIIPDGFLSVAGGTLNVFSVDSLTFSSLPTDGTNSLNGSGVAGINSPTNFAGATGMIQSNVISGDDGPNNLPGTAGDDVFSTGGGNDTLSGLAGNDTLDGGMGADTAIYSGNRSGYTITPTASGFTVGGSEGTDTLTSIERFDFADQNIAIDLGTGQAAGDTVRIIGAAFDENNINPTFVGIGLDLFDSGMSMLEVSQLALGTSLWLSIAGSTSNEAFVNTVYENVVGVLPSNAVRDAYVGLLQGSGGAMTQAELLVLAANANANATNINLVGLQEAGVEFV
jgi:serralysin